MLANHFLNVTLPHIENEIIKNRINSEAVFNTHSKEQKTKTLLTN